MLLQTRAQKGPLIMPRVVIWSLSLILLAALPATATAPPEPKTEEQKVFYALGLAMSQSIGAFNLTEAELEMVQSGLYDGVLNKPRKVDLQVYGPKVQELHTALSLSLIHI